MTVATGQESFVGTAPEVAWGTAVAATAYNRFVSQNFLPDSDETPGDDSLGLAFNSGKDVFRKRTAGEIVFDTKYQGYDRWLKNLFGAPTTTALTGGDDGAYKHEYVLSTTRPIGMSLELHLKIFKAIIAGLKLNKLNVAMGVGIQRLTFGGIGKAFVDPVGTVNSSPTFVEDISGIKPVKALESASPGTAGGVINVGFTLGVGTAGTFASPTYYCAQEPATIDIEAPLKEDDICLGDPGLQEPTLNGKFVVSGAFPRQLVDDDFIEFFLAANTPVYLRFRYDGTGPIIGGGTQWYSWFWDIPYARIKKALGQVQNAGAIIENVEWVSASPTQTAADTLKLTLWNKLAAVT